MNILILGAGGREHTLAWKIRQSPHCNTLYIAPGNAGTGEMGENLDLSLSDFEKIKSLIKEKAIDLLLVGPEDPLVQGIRDYLEAESGLRSLKIIGPGKAGALLEGSKDFSKDFMQRHGIPTAQAKTFTVDQISEGEAFLEALEAPYVLKADGLAAGKGVLILNDLQEAKEALARMLKEKLFGQASEKVLVEEYLHGIELSVFVLTDGEDYVLLPEAKDYKRIGEKDTGPNTGGMGAISPVPFADQAFMEKVKSKVIHPTINGLRQDQIPYKGFIFFGLMNVKGEPMVIEYNVRMGDPETQAVIPRIEGDFLDLLIATADGKLKGKSITIEPQTAATVVMVSQGYPGSYEKGFSIDGLEEAKGSLIFHAGTALKDGKITNQGGRVLASTGLGQSIEKAIQSAYDGMESIHWQGKTFRKDIGQDLLNYQSQ